MTTKEIEGGYVLFARKFLSSSLMDKPPLWVKLFTWMLLKANRKNGYKGLKVGQFDTKISEMQDAMAYYVGYRREAPTPKQIRVIYEGLAKGLTEGSTKGTEAVISVEALKGKRGLRITILNYKKYQDPKNYEGHKEKQSKKPHEGHSEKFTKGFCRAYLISKQEEYKKNKKIYKYISPTMTNFVVDFIFHIHDQKQNLAPTITKNFIENSFTTVLDLVRLDGFDFKYIRDVVRFAVKDAFWKENLLSLTTLRRRSKTNDLKKFQNIANKYESEKNSKPKKINGRSEQNALACHDFIESMMQEADYEEH